jgi:cell division protein FtsW
VSAASISRGRKAKRKPAAAKPKAAAQSIEYSLLLTATLCLLAFGAVMVFSASSTTSLLGSSGDSAYYLKRTVLFGVAGLFVMRFLSKRGVAMLKPLTPMIMVGSLIALFAVLLPGIGVEVNGAKRWIGAGLFQIQPSEVAKVALVLYAAAMLAERPKLTRSVRDMVPVLSALGLICALVVIEPDLGTAMVSCFAIAAILIAAGARMRDLAMLAAGLGALVVLAVLIEPYRMERLTGFINPAHDPSGAGFQAIQAKIAMGSGGIFGVGLGESLQKAFYLPEAHTDMIAAVIGEELGLAGIMMVVGLYGLLGYAGLQTARKAKDRYTKLLAAGLTSMILVQAVINLCAVMGLAPLTGVPLPLISYGNSSMLVTLASVGLLLNIASGATAGASRSGSGGGARLRVVDGGRTSSTSGRSKSRDSRGRHGGARRTRAGGSRRASR